MRLRNSSQVEKVESNRIYLFRETVFTMKYTLAVVALVATLCLVRADDGCENNVANCNALFSSVAHAERDLETFTNQQLEKSFDFLLLSYVFDQYKLDRPGFEKMYRKISDKAWEDTQGLIKYRSKRGLVVELNGLANATENVLETRTLKTMNRAVLLNTDEMGSLKLALAYEKALASESHRIHKKISHAHGEGQVYDPDVAHYLDEEIIEYQSGLIRQLTGHIHNLQAISSEATRDLGLHMFDEYLAKLE